MKTFKLTISPIFWNMIKKGIKTADFRKPSSFWPEIGSWDFNKKEKVRILFVNSDNDKELGMVAATVEVKSRKNLLEDINKNVKGHKQQLQHIKFLNMYLGELENFVFVKIKKVLEKENK